METGPWTDYAPGASSAASAVTAQPAQMVAPTPATGAQTAGDGPWNDYHPSANAAQPSKLTDFTQPTQTPNQASIPNVPVAAQSVTPSKGFINTVTTPEERNFVSGLVGGIENAMAIGSGTVATVAGDAAGLTRQTINYLGDKLGWGQKDTNDVNDWLSGIGIQQGIKNTLTYQPQTDVGQSQQSALSTLMTPITSVANTIGQTVTNATNNQVLGDTASDVATAAIPYGISKTAPYAANVARGVGNAWSEAPTSGKVATVALAANLLVGNPLGGLGHLLTDADVPYVGKALWNSVGDQIKAQYDWNTDMAASKRAAEPPIDWTGSGPQPRNEWQQQAYDFTQNQNKSSLGAWLAGSRSDVEEGIRSHGADWVDVPNIPISPDTLNHNTIITTNSLSKDVTDPTVLNTVKTMQEKANNGEYTSPIQVQADLFDLQRNAGKNVSSDVSQGMKSVADATTLTGKLPVFDTNEMVENETPKPLVEAAQHANFQTSNDPFADTPDPLTPEQRAAKNEAVWAYRAKMEEGGLFPPGSSNVRTSTSTVPLPPDASYVGNNWQVPEGGTLPMGFKQTPNMQGVPTSTKTSMGPSSNSVSTPNVVGSPEERFQHLNYDQGFLENSRQIPSHQVADYLNSNPEAAKDFLNQYGHLPPGVMGMMTGDAASTVIPMAERSPEELKYGVRYYAQRQVFPQALAQQEQALADAKRMADKGVMLQNSSDPYLQEKGRSLVQHTNDVLARKIDSIWKNYHKVSQ